MLQFITPQLAVNLDRVTSVAWAPDGSATIEFVGAPAKRLPPEDGLAFADWLERRQNEGAIRSAFEEMQP